MLYEIAVRKAWFPLLVFVLWVVVSRLSCAYESLPALDIAVHLTGGVAIAYFCLGSLAILERRGFLRPVERLLRATLVFALTCAAAVFWEFAEYISDHTIGTHGQRGLEDTLLDMLFGIVGGIVYIALEWRERRQEEQADR